MMFSGRKLAASVAKRSFRMASSPRSVVMMARQARTPVLRTILRSLSTTPAAAATATTPYSATVVENPEMFCRQCEQTKDHFACTSLGVCGKTPETAAIQDALMELVKSVSTYCVAARKADIPSDLLQEANAWTLSATFSTLTNVNFDETRIQEYLEEGLKVKEELRRQLENAQGASSTLVDLPGLQSGMTLEQLEDFGRSVSIPSRMAVMKDDDCFSLNEIATYGLKGACAYLAHCLQLGKMDELIMADVHEIFAKLASSEPDMDGLLAVVDKVGAVSARVLAMLDESHASCFGIPEPTPVRTTAVEGKAILVSGHDIMDLYELLKQTEGTGVNVYTHGEMLPAHAYPELKKFDHLVGNYGTAWQNQKFEFAGFPGPVIVTTNCIIEPRRVYKNRIYTMNQVGFDGVRHIGADRDFSAVIEQAKNECKGFERTVEPARYHTTGFNHRAVLPLANDILEAFKKGELAHIFLIGGCDGSQWDRNYFSELAEETPDDSIILTMGCAKNRVIHSEKLLNATLPNGLPRVLDMGQCNDSYSAIVVAQELAKALNCGVNELPLSLAVSHLEQKAACVLLTLLHLGVKNIRLGPSLPAYVSPNVLKVLSENYNLMPTGDFLTDLEGMMEGK